MDIAVYLLGAATALLCCGLLLRNHRRTGARLLLWSGLCFGLLSLDNLLLFVDRIIIPNVDLSLWRTPAALAGVALLLYGLV